MTMNFLLVFSQKMIIPCNHFRKYLFSSRESNIIGRVIVSDLDYQIGQRQVYRMQGHETEPCEICVIGDEKKDGEPNNASLSFGSVLEEIDYETQNQYTGVLIVNNGVAADGSVYEISQEIIVNITNVNDIAPEFDSPWSSVFRKLGPIGRLSASDLEGDDVSISIVSDEIILDGSNFLTFINQL